MSSKTILTNNLSTQMKLRDLIIYIRKLLIQLLSQKDRWRFVGSLGAEKKHKNPNVNSRTSIHTAPSN